MFRPASVLGRSGLRALRPAAPARGMASSPLSAREIEIVKSTAPILEVGGETLTKAMYVKLMKTEARHHFNQTHQKTGDQARALAYSVLCYSKHVDNIGALAPLVPTIVHKHVALEVKPEHYPIVGGCLLEAIREVLGAETATDEVIAAWGKAYGVLADALIGAEKNLEEELAAAPGGWRGQRTFKVVAKAPASLDGSVISYDLEPADGGAVPMYLPGQYTTLVMKLAGQEGITRRNYSLSRAADGRSLRISVKRLEGGLVSGHLYENVKVGDTLELAPPVGEFTLSSGCPVPAEAAAAEGKCPVSGHGAAEKKSARDLLLLSAGVGITPTLAMLQAATAAGAPARKVVFGHYTHNAGSFALAPEVEAAAAEKENVSLFTAFTRPQAEADAASGLRAADALGRINAEHLKKMLAGVKPEGLDVYLLGPKGFMHEARGLVRAHGVPDSAVKYEFFGPFDPAV